ncbi:transcriptional regulator RefZ [Bacillus carboniphilus]|uniref:Transcriptional regulator RefZ n=1 Tax=Bacillus carboniphilus TaxID=86663 RepID=A0ABP3G3N8_9BACI
MTEPKKKKNEIFNSALYMFHTKGYTGTSLRDIASKANVNVAHIAYYFENKQGLLEHSFSVFFEEYLAEMEKAISELERNDPRGVMRDLVDRLMKFQCQNITLTRFVWRELSIDSQVVREIISTYLMKERYFFKSLLEAGFREKAYEKRPVSYTIIQLKGMLMMPFLHAQSLSEVWQVYPHEPYFLNKYSKEIMSWLEHYLFVAEETQLRAIQ